MHGQWGCERQGMNGGISVKQDEVPKRGRRSCGASRSRRRNVTVLLRPQGTKAGDLCLVTGRAADGRTGAVAAASSPVVKPLAASQ